jgi:transcription termination factor Rho
LYEKRVFSSIQLNRSDTRREELLLAPDIQVPELATIWLAHTPQVWHVQRAGDL